MNSAETCGDGIYLIPALERAHFGRSPLRVANADLRGVAVAEAPFDRTTEGLSQRLGRFKAVARGDRHPPCGDLLRAEFADRLVAEGSDGLAQQPSQLAERRRLESCWAR